MIRLLFTSLLLATLAQGANAQILPLARPAAPSVTAPKPAAPTPAITPEQARQALDMLQDDTKRAAFVATLQTIAKAPAAGEVAKLAIPRPAIRSSSSVADQISAC